MKRKLDKENITAVYQSCLWAVCILLFPIFSGTVSVMLSLRMIEALFFQGFIMLASLMIPLILVLCGKWKWEDIGFDRYDAEGSKKAYHFLPLIIILIPVAIQGFYLPSAAYVFGNLFLYLMVGISEEIYFRGIIPNYLRKAFSVSKVILFSAVIFGIGHIAAAFTTSNSWEICFTILNAFLFGWLAIEIKVISNSIVPAVLLHFLFDFETKIIVMDGASFMLADVIRGTAVFIAALWLAFVIQKSGCEAAS